MVMIWVWLLCFTDTLMVCCINGWLLSLIEIRLVDGGSSSIGTVIIRGFSSLRCWDLLCSSIGWKRLRCRGMGSSYTQILHCTSGLLFAWSKVWVTDCASLLWWHSSLLWICTSTSEVCLAMLEHIGFILHPSSFTNLLFDWSDDCMLVLIITHNAPRWLWGSSLVLAADLWWLWVSSRLPFPILIDRVL